MTIQLNESMGAPTKVGKRWRVTIARPGQGASGYYPEDVLKETGPAAFPPGTKSFFNHDPKRDVRDMVGTFPDGAFWNDEEGELQADLEPFPRFRDVLNEAGAAVEVSIHAQGNKDDAGVVRGLLFNRANTVDLVGFGGLEGSGLKFQLESMFSAAAEATKSDADASAQKEREGIQMEKEQFEALQKQINDTRTLLENFIAESRNEVQGQADAEAVASAVEAKVSEALAVYREKEAAIDAANLLPKQAEALKERALNGEDIQEALTEAVALVEEFKTTFEVTNDAARGNVVIVNESHVGSDPNSLIIGRWNK